MKSWLESGSYFNYHVALKKVKSPLVVLFLFLFQVFSFEKKRQKTELL